MSAKQSVLGLVYTGGQVTSTPPGRMHSFFQQGAMRGPISSLPPPAAGQGSDSLLVRHFAARRRRRCPVPHLLARPDARRGNRGPDSFQVTRRSRRRNRSSSPRVPADRIRPAHGRHGPANNPAGKLAAVVSSVISRNCERPATSVLASAWRRIRQTADTAKPMHRTATSEQPCAEDASGIATASSPLILVRGPASATTPAPILIARASNDRIRRRNICSSA